jgi:glycosyltransferase involved in cell wall biosynthesis
MRNRLLSLNNYHYRRGGSDAVFFDHQKLFRGIDWETIPFAMHHPSNEPSEWSEYFADELEFGNAYSPRQKLIMAGKVIYSLEAKDKLKRLIERARPDIAHAHCIYHHLSPSVLTLLREEGIPTVMTAHDLKIACPAYKMFNSTGICEKCKGGNLIHVVKNRCIHDSLVTSTLVAVESSIHKSLGLYKKNLDKIVTPSIFYREKLIEWGYSPEQLVYIPNFIHYDSYTPKYQPGDYFLYFGRLAPEKGVDTLIKAAIQSGVNLSIAGTGPCEEDLRALVPVDSTNIKFLGFCTGEKLWSLIREARAIVLPSQWYENAPISVLEAYASGKPIIGSRIGGIPEMVKEGETGWLFDSNSVEGLANQLLHVESASDTSLEEMGRVAYDYVTSTFTAQRYLQDMSQLYQSLGVNFHSTDGNI